MSRVFQLIIISAAALFTTTALADGFDRACGKRWSHQWCGGHVRLVYPPVGYVLDPADALPSIYLANQGPVFSGPDVYALPTFSEGVYADVIPYPYIGHGYYRTPYYPYYPSYWAPYASYRSRSYLPRPYRVVGAYAYRPAPSARIITVPQP